MWYCLAIVFSVFAFPFTACSSEHGYSTAPPITVYFSGPNSFSNKYSVNSYMFSSDNELAYVQFNSSGDIATFKLTKFENSLVTKDILSQCLSKVPSSNLVTDFQKYKATSLILNQNGEMERKDCEYEQNIHSLWLKDNPKINLAIKSGSDAKKGVYVRAIPYFGEAKDDLQLTKVQISEVKDTLALHPYQFFHISDLPSLSVMNNSKGDVFIVRFENKAYAFHWYQYSLKTITHNKERTI